MTLPFLLLLILLAIGIIFLVRKMSNSGERIAPGAPDRTYVQQVVMNDPLYAEQPSLIATLFESPQVPQHDPPVARELSPCLDPFAQAAPQDATPVPDQGNGCASPDAPQLFQDTPSFDPGNSCAAPDFSSDSGSSGSCSPFPIPAASNSCRRSP